MVLFVGLGNPGPDYAKHRHNIGFMALDAIAARHGAGPWRARFHGEVAEARIGPTRLWLLKPATYMNESGRSVADAMRFLKLDPGRLVVFHDELDIAPGRLKTKTGGGAAGHNGLRSIDAHLGPDYRRVRLGIGHPGHRDAVARYVLHDFAKADRSWLDPLLDALADAAPDLVRDPPGAGDAAFASRVAQALEPPRPKPPKPAKPAQPADPGGTVDGATAPDPTPAPGAARAATIKSVD